MGWEIVIIMLNYKFLAPYKFSIIKNVYDFNYFTINSFDEINKCLKFKFANGFNSYMFFPKNTETAGLITFPNFLIKNFDIIQHASSDSLLKITNSVINDLDVEVFESDLLFNNVEFSNISEDLQTSKWVAAKNEITEYNYYHGSQIIHQKLYPEKLHVLGVTINSELEKDITKSCLQIFSIPGVIANYLMQLRYKFKNVISYNHLFNYQDGDNYYKFYDILIDFTHNNILYSNSVKNCEKVVLGKKDLDLETESFFLNKFKIYSKKEAVEQYLLYNKAINITQNHTLKDVYDKYRRYFYVYSHTDNDLIKNDLINARLRHKCALVRIMNPEIRHYEVGKNWSFDNLDSPKRYLDAGNYSYDSYSGLGYNKHAKQFDRHCPPIDWNYIGKVKGTWTDRLEYYKNV